MSIDLSKLTPAPWMDDSGDVLDSGCESLLGGWDDGSGWFHNWPDAAFIALARNAFDVMMRRRMYALPDADGKWIVLKGQDWFRNDCPFTALVEADKWLTAKENA